MRILRLKDVIQTTGLARSTIYKYISEGRFPKPVSLGARSVGWVESEIHDWIHCAVDKRDGNEYSHVTTSNQSNVSR